MNTCDSKCGGCARREFIKRLGLLAGAGAMTDALSAPLPSATPPSAIPSKSGALKVRVVFAFNVKEEVQTSPDWPNRGFDFRPVMKNMVDALNAGVAGVEFISAKAASKEDGARIASEDAATGGVAGYVVVQMNPWHNAVYGIVASGKPVLYTALPYGGDGGWLTNDSDLRRKNTPAYESICAFDFKYVVGMAGAFAHLKDGTAADFVAAARAYRLSVTPAFSSRRVREGRLPCRSAEETLARVRGVRILVLERGWGDDAEAICKDFGVEIERCTFAELNGFYDRVDAARARAMVEEWQRTALDVADVSDETLLACARQRFAMEDMLKAHNAKAITIDCLSGCYSGKLKAYPCLGFMELQDHGLMGTCESDLASVLTMLVFGAMTDRVGYISDPVLDAPTRSIVYAHCVSTRRFFGIGGREAPYSILTHSEDRGGASVRALGPVGYPVTTMKIVAEKRKIALQSAITTGNDDDSRACRTKIIAEVAGDFEKASRAWDIFGWHRVTFYGDFVDSVRALAKKLGYEVVMES